MNRVRYFINIVALAVPLCWTCICIAQTSVKEDELVSLTKTILQKASEDGYFGLTEFGNHLVFTDPDPDEKYAETYKRLGAIKEWAKSLFVTERAVIQNPTKLQGVSYKLFLVTRELDEKGKPLPIVKVRFNVPKEVRTYLDLGLKNTPVFEWRLVFEQNNRPKSGRKKDEPDMLLHSIDQITPAPPGPF